MSPAYQAAIDLIKHYVERGDSIESLKAGHMESASPGGMSASIGGYMPVGGKSWSTDWICVYRDVNGVVVNKAYKLREIYDFCRTGQEVLL